LADLAFEEEGWKKDEEEEEVFMMRARPSSESDQG
jgi:hypothetical protein